MKKRTFIAALGLSVMLALSACGGASSSSGSGASTASEASSQTSTEASANSACQTDSCLSNETEETITGGWEINQGSLDIDDNSNKEAKEAFEKAFEDDSTYKVIAYLGSQVVAGTNYSYLCTETESYPDSDVKYVIVNVYEDLDGKAVMTGVSELLEGTDADADGGWSYNQEESSVENNADVKQALEKVTSELTGATYDPVAYIGSQVVAGTNYAVLCSVTPAVQNPQRSFCLVTIYEDTDGNCSITETKDIDIGIDSPFTASESESETE